MEVKTLSTDAPTFFDTRSAPFLPTRSIGQLPDKCKHIHLVNRYVAFVREGSCSGGAEELGVCLISKSESVRQIGSVELPSDRQVLSLRLGTYANPHVIVQFPTEVEIYKLLTRSDEEDPRTDLETDAIRTLTRVVLVQFAERIAPLSVYWHLNARWEIVTCHREFVAVWAMKDFVPKSGPAVHSVVCDVDMKNLGTQMTPYTNAAKVLRVLYGVDISTQGSDPLFTMTEVNERSILMVLFRPSNVVVIFRDDDENHDPPKFQFLGVTNFLTSQLKIVDFMSSTLTQRVQLPLAHLQLARHANNMKSVVRQVAISPEGDQSINLAITTRDSGVSSILFHRAIVHDQKEIASCHPEVYLSELVGSVSERCSEEISVMSGSHDFGFSVRPEGSGVGYLARTTFGATESSLSVVNFLGTFLEGKVLNASHLFYQEPLLLIARGAESRCEFVRLAEETPPALPPGFALPVPEENRTWPGPIETIVELIAEKLDHKFLTGKVAEEMRQILQTNNLAITKELRSVKASSPDDHQEFADNLASKLAETVHKCMNMSIQNLTQSLNNVIKNNLIPAVKQTVNDTIAEEMEVLQDSIVENIQSKLDVSGGGGGSGGAGEGMISRIENLVEKLREDLIFSNAKQLSNIQAETISRVQAHAMQHVADPIQVRLASLKDDLDQTAGNLSSQIAALNRRHSSGISPDQTESILNLIRDQQDQHNNYLLRSADVIMSLDRIHDGMTRLKSQVDWLRHVQSKHGQHVQASPSYDVVGPYRSARLAPEVHPPSLVSCPDCLNPCHIADLPATCSVPIQPSHRPWADRIRAPDEFISDAPSTQMRFQAGRRRAAPPPTYDSVISDGSLESDVSPQLDLASIARVRDGKSDALFADGLLRKLDSEEREVALFRAVARDTREDLRGFWTILTSRHLHPKSFTDKTTGVILLGAAKLIADSLLSTTSKFDPAVTPSVTYQSTVPILNTTKGSVSASTESLPHRLRWLRQALIAVDVSQSQLEPNEIADYRRQISKSVRDFMKALTNDPKLTRGLNQAKRDRYSVDLETILDLCQLIILQ